MNRTQASCQHHLLQVENLKTWFPVKRGIWARTVDYVHAVDGVSLYMDQQETVGLVGESGCGKTTFGRTLLGLERPVSGKIAFDGRDLLDLSRAEYRKLRRRMQIIFQDPVSSLNPRMNVMDIVTEGLGEYGMIKGKREFAARKLLSEVGLEQDAVFRYPHEFSGGQRQRINIARAISLKPDFIVCDEPVSALDVSVQAQVVNLLMDLRDKYRLSYLFISHDLSVVRNISNRIAVMYLGKIVEQGPVDAVIGRPLHPYTRALVEAVPVPGVSKEDKMILEGGTPSATSPPTGCRFHTRCPEAMAVCRQLEPVRTDSGPQQVWCHLYAG